MSGHIAFRTRISASGGIENRVSTEAYERAIDERTCMVPLTHVSLLNGFRSDVAAVPRIAQANGALGFLDGYQDCGTWPLNVSQRDVFTFRTKYFELAAASRRFEGNTRPIPHNHQARPALDLLVRTGMENVAAQIECLTRTFMQGARDLRVESKTAADSVGPPAVLRSKDAALLVDELTARRIALRLDGARFAFHVYNAKDDVHTALAALDENLDLLARAS